MPTKKQSLLKESLLDYFRWVKREVEKDPKEITPAFVLLALVSAFIFACIAVTETAHYFFNTEN